MTMEESTVAKEMFTIIAMSFETIGTLAMVVGFIIALVLGVRALIRKQGAHEAFLALRETMAGAILLGLEILVAADLVRTITSKPSLEDAAVLGIIVLIRTILSMSIQIEIEGVLPWKRALFTSGAQIISEEINKDRHASQKAQSSP